MKRKAIVMGATSGIGMATAKCLAENGWEVGIAGRRIERLHEVEASTSGIVCGEQIDVTSDDAPARLTGLINRLGGMDLYVHCSGIGWQNTELDSEKEILTAETNCTGFVRMVDTAFNWYAQQQATTSNDGGKTYRIACVTSIAGTKGLGAAPSYSATKRFQSHYLECLAQQARMRRLPIVITDIRPGFVSTDLIAGQSYPLQMQPGQVARQIVRAVELKKNVCIIDWRYHILVDLWRLIPRWVWTRLRFISGKDTQGCKPH